ncbi:mediator of RNA polymerase II transcription subunit, putative [Anopheles sinensis]|uniref:Mediator of RNA polymerase II transcription subunit, putative n=1 Tax=Anopheles sinensis TaxID=74873 RepID=A0A084WEG4_ANOSI|nr:mediator of RNA polymerase II transcription subunit, putative [Anopheles sinensis]
MSQKGRIDSSGGRSRADRVLLRVIWVAGALQAEYASISSHESAPSVSVHFQRWIERQRGYDLWLTKPFTLGRKTPSFDESSMPSFGDGSGAVRIEDIARKHLPGRAR